MWVTYSATTSTGSCSLWCRSHYIVSPHDRWGVSWSQCTDMSPFTPRMGGHQLEGHHTFIWRSQRHQTFGSPKYKATGPSTKTSHGLRCRPLIKIHYNIYSSLDMILKDLRGRMECENTWGVWFPVTTKDGSGSGVGQISMGFGYCRFEFGGWFLTHVRFLDWSPQNLSSLVFRPWISNRYPK